MSVCHISDMMEELNTSEAKTACHAFFAAIYGSDVYLRWLELKRRMRFDSESQLMAWALDMIDLQLQEQTDMAAVGNNTGSIKSEAYSSLEDDDDDDDDMVVNAFPTADTDVYGRTEKVESAAPNSLKLSLTADGPKSKSPAVAVEPLPIVFPTSTVMHVDEDGEKSDASPLGSPLSLAAHMSQTEIVMPSDQELVAPLNGVVDPGQPLPIGVLNNISTNAGGGMIFSDDTDDIDGNDDTPQSTRKYTCPQCGKRFGLIAHLNAHMRSNHLRQKHGCPLCHQDFTQLGSLKIHIKTIHQGIKDHACDYCGKRFSQSSTMKRHVRNLHKPIDRVDTSVQLV